MIAQFSYSIDWDLESKDSFSRHFTIKVEGISVFENKDIFIL
jgi:hypothetical protein